MIAHVDTSLNLNTLLLGIMTLAGTIYAARASSQQRKIHTLVNSTLTKVTEQRDALELENLSLRKSAIESGVARSDLPDSIMNSEMQPRAANVRTRATDKPSA